MAVRTLDNRTSIFGLLSHVSYTLSRLKAHPLGAPHIPAFEALRAEGLSILTQEIALNEAQIDAQARVDVADDGLDGFAGRTSKELLVTTRDDRDHALYRHFFGNKTLAQLKRPVLAGQLKTMKTWPAALTDSGVPALQAMAPELVPLVEAGTAAEQARLDARQASRKFRDFGERQQWLDRLNAARKEIHGALAKLPHAHPGLPSDFASGFFLSTQDRDGEPSEDEALDTPAALREHIASLHKSIEEAEARLAEVEAEEAAAQKAAEARAAEEAALAELDRAAAELEKKRAALREKLAAKPA